jgi:hypothetical protein
LLWLSRKNFFSLIICFFVMTKVWHGFHFSVNEKKSFFPIILILKLPRIGAVGFHEKTFFLLILFL